MRLWHYKLISVLPRTQLLAQWRELNSIFKKQDNHILINYIYDYPKSTLKTYIDMVIKEIEHRGYVICSWDNYNNYFKDVVADGKHFNEHDSLYLKICYYNLVEKFLCGQKDFNYEIYDKLVRIYCLNTKG